MTEQTPLPYGYVTFTGRAMSDAAVNAYNAASARIETFEAAGLPVPESLRNDRHNILVTAAIA